LSLGITARHPSTSTPSAEELNDGKTGSPREYTHTLMGIHENKVFPFELDDAVYLNKK
jgi:hypothetical protein